jgi:hypothetical protein
MSFFLESIRNILFDRITENPPVMVVGMHRSGTGVLTDILQRLGVFMGKQLSANRESFFFQNINKDLLDMVGCNWRHIDDLPASADILRQHSWMLGYARQRVKAGLLREHFEVSLPHVFSGMPHTWGWKDPRNSLLIPLWREVFPGLTVIHIFRDGRDVALSLLRRDMKLNKDKSVYTDSRLRERFVSYFGLWEVYVRRIYASISSVNKQYSLSYENLLKNPEKEIRNLAKILDVALPENIEHVCSVIDSSKNVHNRDEHFPWMRDVQLPDTVLRELGYDQQAQMSCPAELSPEDCITQIILNDSH